MQLNSIYSALECNDDNHQFTWLLSSSKNRYHL